jgi:hypothetical protein
VTANDLASVTRGERPIFDTYSTRTLREAFRVIEHAHRLLIAPDRWTRHVWARDRAGNEVNAASRAARRWCAGGAVLAANGDLYAGRGDVAIPVDPHTKQAALIRSPRRVAVALEVLGVGFTQTSRNLIEASPPPAGASGETKAKLDQQHPTLLATDINDLPLIKYPHVVLAFGWTMAALRDEVERRAARGARPARARKAT